MSVALTNQLFENPTSRRLSEHLRPPTRIRSLPRGDLTSCTLYVLEPAIWSAGLSRKLPPLYWRSERLSGYLGGNSVVLPTWGIRVIASSAAPCCLSPNSGAVICPPPSVSSNPHSRIHRATYRQLFGTTLRMCVDAEHCTRQHKRLLRTHKGGRQATQTAS